MKTLIIDNYDSFTFNLYQIVAHVNGSLPTVVHNNADWDTLRRISFDNIVISPGPGRPERDADFGICRRAIEEAEIPILGICLGHQGIGYLHGAEVALAPEPVHGRSSAIYHDESPLFAGIPQQIQVVRYHSLMLKGELPDDLDRIAWTADGIVMGCRHRTRPLWGVQFHPESIGSQYGARLIENFRDLTRAHRQSGEARDSAVLAPELSVVPTRSDPRSPTPDAGRPGHEMHVCELDMYADPEQVFAALFATQSDSFWLDSSLETPASRFHFMGDASGPLSEVVRYDVAKKQLQIARGDALTTREESIFSYLIRALADRRILPDPGLPFDFSCGYVGYFGYELKAECGGDLAHEADTPDAYFIFADRVLAFDAAAKRMYLLCLAREGDSAGAHQWFNAMEARLRDVGPLPPINTGGDAQGAGFKLGRGRESYIDDIDRCLQQIRLGESYEICLTNRLRLDAGVAPLDYYRVLRHANPAPYAAFLNLGEVCIACSSPERFLRIDRDGWAESKPIKGTLPRGRNEQEDAELRRRLQASEKDRAENLMIVDLVRNDLGVVCEIGSVSVPRYMDVESYATVHQLVSTIRGRLRADMTAVDCIQSAFPGGSMTGAPKIRTMQIIDELEPDARGVYSGSIGWLGSNGAADLNIVIRTAVIHPHEICIGVGGAIVALSDPQAEFEEILLKGRALLRAAAHMTGTSESPGTSHQDMECNHFGYMESVATMDDSIEALRSNLDTIDARLVELLGDRLDLCRRIAVYKRDNKIPMMQPHRVEHVKERCATMGGRRGLRAEFIDELYTLIINEACQTEDDIIDTPAISTSLG